MIIRGITPNILSFLHKDYEIFKDLPTLNPWKIPQFREVIPIYPKHWNRFEFALIQRFNGNKIIVAEVELTQMWGLQLSNGLRVSNPIVASNKSDNTYA